MDDHTYAPHDSVATADCDAPFRTTHLDAGLGGRAARSGAVTVGSQGAKFVLGLVGTAVLSRLLTPDDYGLVNMVVALTGFISLFKYLGLSTATVQAQELTHAQVSSMFWLNTGVSVLVMLVTAAAAPLVAIFYGDGRLTLLTMAFAVSFIFGGLGVQHAAVLTRQMRFAALAAVDIASLIVGIAVGVALAWRGFGYWALVGNTWAVELTYTVGVWTAFRWCPSRPSIAAGVRRMLTFGRNLTAFNVIYYLVRNIDNVLIGRFWGAQQLGYYARAYQLFLLPMNQINQPVGAVALPTLSRLAGAPERYRAAYLRVLEKVAMLTMPAVALAITTSDWLVRIVLGPRWAATGTIFALLGLAGLTQSLSNAVGWLYTTQGRTRGLLRWGMVSGAISITAIVAGLPWGAVGVATTYGVTSLCLNGPILFWLAGREGPVSTADLYRTVAPAACACACVLVSVFALRRLVQFDGALLGLAMSFAVAVAVTVAVYVVLPAGRDALMHIKYSALLVTGSRGESA